MCAVISGVEISLLISGLGLEQSLAFLVTECWMVSDTSTWDRLSIDKELNYLQHR